MQLASGNESDRVLQRNILLLSLVNFLSPEPHPRSATWHQSRSGIRSRIAQIDGTECWKAKVEVLGPDLVRQRVKSGLPDCVLGCGGEGDRLLLQWSRGPAAAAVDQGSQLRARQIAKGLETEVSGTQEV